MNELVIGIVRERDDGSFEILAQRERSIDPETGERVIYEQWEPVASYIINRRTLEVPGVPAWLTIHELLLLEGWTPPHRDIN